jgi:predicted neutral ceramidase superfamily lipid hydrolase
MDSRLRGNDNPVAQATFSTLIGEDPKLPGHVCSIKQAPGFAEERLFVTPGLHPGSSW